MSNLRNNEIVDSIFEQVDMLDLTQDEKFAEAQRQWEEINLYAD